MCSRIPLDPGLRFTLLDATENEWALMKQRQSTRRDSICKVNGLKKKVVQSVIDEYALHLMTR